MSASSILLVAATIVAVDGGMASIDVGKAQYLESGDRGQAFYELRVDGVPKRIEIGPVTIIAAGGESSSIISDSRIPLRAGYRVEIRLPAQRLPESEKVGERLYSTEYGAPPLTGLSSVEAQPYLESLGKGPE